MGFSCVLGFAPSVRVRRAQVSRAVNSLHQNRKRTQQDASEKALQRRGDRTGLQELAKAWGLRVGEVCLQDVGRLWLSWARSCGYRGREVSRVGKIGAADLGRF